MKFVAASAISLALLPASVRADDPLPDLGPVSAFSLTSQDRKLVSLTGLRGKVVAVPFYTTCPYTCPLLIQRLIEVARALGVDFGNAVVFVAIMQSLWRDGR